MSKQSIADVKVLLQGKPSKAQIKELQADDRKGVANLLKSYWKRLDKEKTIREKFGQMKKFENIAYEKGFQFIAGIDEVGRGPLAGPVVACAVILPKDIELFGVNDSKQLSEKKRAVLFEEIQKKALAIGVGIIEPTVIDEVNIYEATKLAMQQAIDHLSVSPDYLLLDAMLLENDLPQEKLIKGDARSISIAAASIIAKVTRDNMMAMYDVEFSGYGFAKNAGYGTKEHLEGLKKHGATPIHRKSFEPVKSMV